MYFFKKLITFSSVQIVLISSWRLLFHFVILWALSMVMTIRSLPCDECTMSRSRSCNKEKAESSSWSHCIASHCIALHSAARLEGPARVMWRDRARARGRGVRSRVQWTTRRRTRSRRMINNENTAKQTVAARLVRGTRRQSEQRSRSHRPRDRRRSRPTRKSMHEPQPAFNINRHP